MPGCGSGSGSEILSDTGTTLELRVVSPRSSNGSPSARSPSPDVRQQFSTGPAEPASNLPFGYHPQPSDSTVRRQSLRRSARFPPVVTLPLPAPELHSSGSSETDSQDSGDYQHWPDFVHRGRGTSAALTSEVAPLSASQQSNSACSQEASESDRSSPVPNYTRQHQDLPGSIELPVRDAQLTDTDTVEVSLAELLRHTNYRYTVDVPGALPERIQLYSHFDGFPAWICTEQIRLILGFGEPEVAPQHSALHSSSKSLQAHIQVSDFDRTYTWLPSFHPAPEAAPPASPLQLEVSLASSPEHSSPNFTSPTPTPSPDLHALKTSRRKSTISLLPNLPLILPQRSDSLASRRTASNPEAAALIERLRL